MFIFIKYNIQKSFKNHTVKATVSHYICEVKIVKYLYNAVSRGYYSLLISLVQHGFTLLLFSKNAKFNLLCLLPPNAYWVEAQYTSSEWYQNAAHLILQAFMELCVHTIQSPSRIKILEESTWVKNIWWRALKFHY